MRRRSLRTVDPAIDDPDASTSPPPLVSPSLPILNVVPPKPSNTPKTRHPRFAFHLPTAFSNCNGPVPLTVPSLVGKSAHISRPRGFSAPGAFPPIIQASQAVVINCPTATPRTPYYHSTHNLGQLTPSVIKPTSPAFNNIPAYPFAFLFHAYTFKKLCPLHVLL
ncbi:hypothetical protein R3P38DRAFT_3210897 [Favolaschia claudopus]|uniref:Uncharacterized protein n=1 Tax=Favolaschia claudopus TaxID=2862362 RepID=A0AAW0AG04_9AGAR